MATMMPTLRARLRRLCVEAGPEQAEDVLRVLSRLMQGVNEPNPERHRIRLSNPALFDKLTKYESSIEVLEACGWEFIDIGDNNKADEIWMGFPVQAPAIDMDEVLKEIKDQTFEVTGIEVIEDAPSRPAPKPPAPARTPSSSKSTETAGRSGKVPAPPRIPLSRPPVRPRPSRLQIAELVESRLRSGNLSAPNASGTIRMGRDSYLNPRISQQLKEIRQRQHQRYARSRGRIVTLADLATADVEEENRVARIALRKIMNTQSDLGRYSQRDRRRNADYNLKQIGELALKYTNEFRASRGLPALRWHQFLADIGADHSQDMADGKVPFSHQGFKDRVAMYPMKSNMAAENLARVGGSDPAKGAVDGWINSPGHCKNLLSKTKWCGIGVVSCGGQYMLTQLFG